jgi:hypothetical protein
LLLGPQVSNEVPHFEKIREILSEEVSLDVLFQKAVFPIFIAANSAAAAAHTSSTPEYAQDVMSELASLATAVAKSSLALKIKLLLIYVPIRSKDELASEFDKLLRA